MSYVHTSIGGSYYARCTPACLPACHLTGRRRVGGLISKMHSHPFLLLLFCSSLFKSRLTGTWGMDGRGGEGGLVDQLVS